MFHIAADLGHDVGGHIAAAGQTVGQSGVDLYNSIVDSTKNVLGSIERSGSVTRLVYTSSGGVYMHPTSRFQPARCPQLTTGPAWWRAAAAIKGPHPRGHVFTVRASQNPTSVSPFRHQLADFSCAVRRRKTGAGRAGFQRSSARGTRTSSTPTARARWTAS